MTSYRDHSGGALARRLRWQSGIEADSRVRTPQLARDLLAACNDEPTALTRRRFLGAAAGAIAAVALAGHARATGPHPTAGHRGTRHGSHGMLLLGGHDALYGYHLAMYRTPHDRQVLLRLAAAAPALDVRLRQGLLDRPTLWTLDPQRFDLDRLSPRAGSPLRGFSADIVRGHFERGGSVVHPAVALRIEKVMAFRPLVPPTGPATELQYDVFGHGEHRLLVKRITRRPDFDHVLVLRTASRSGAGLLTLAADGLRSPSLASLTEALREQAGVVATALASIYDDRADLQ